ncbi:transposase family protein [Lyngbya aestuarii]|uniref:transposase family protein n=1 Tax=Lyngbya aestuarii TaxID=118322 RepID=UPI00128F08BA
MSSFLEKIICLGDQGYQGIQKLHKSSQTPHKKQKKELSQKHKKENRDLVYIRIVVEHMYRFFYF